LKLLRSIIELLKDFVGQLEYGDTVASKKAKAHYDYKIDAINIVHERKGRVNEVFTFIRLRPLSQGSFVVT